ncbi:MAG TPA: hypothetical protein VHQ48_15310 [Bradyrhizobium sp.]|jgi:hypothetical protein|nr:hypothetical protein [Bradyrhizobium sp.]
MPGFFLAAQFIGGSMVTWRPERRWLRAERILRMSGIAKRRHKKIVALAFEFLLGGFEVCDPDCDFFPLQSRAVPQFRHAHPL